MELEFLLIVCEIVQTMVCKTEFGKSFPLTLEKQHFNLWIIQDSFHGGFMIYDPIAISKRNLKNLVKTKEAALGRLIDAGILDKDGNLAEIYRSSTKREK